MGLMYYHLSPMKDMEISGKPQKNVVGYDSDYVYTFADSKKKPLEGNAEMKNNVALPGGDVCVGFAVNVSALFFFPIKKKKKRFFCCFAFEDINNL